MTETSAKILPKGSAGAGVIRGELQCQHEDQAAGACQPDKDSEGACETDRKLAVSNEERDWNGMRQDEVFEYRHHERIGAAFLDEFVDPEFESAVEGELGAEDFVLAENQEEDADGDAEESETASV